MEINESCLRAVSLIRSGNELKIKSAGQIALPAGTISAGRVKNGQVLTSKIKELFRLCRPKKITASHIIVSLPEEISYLQVLSFPTLPPDKIEDAVKLNLEHLSPYKQESVYSHFQEIKSENENQIDALTLSANSTDIEGYLTVFSSLNLVPLAFEVPSVSLTRSAGMSGPAVFAFIYPNEVVLSVVWRGATRFSYAAKIGKNALNEIEAAIYQVINYYEAHSPDNQEIKEVCLAGYEVADFQKKLAKDLLDLKVKLLPSKIQTKDYQILPGSESLIALGAALRGLFSLGEDTEVSLLPLGAKDEALKLREKEFFTFLLRIVILTLVGIIVIFAGFWFLLYRLLGHSQTTLADLEKGPKTEEIASLEDEAKNFNSQVEAIYKVKDKKIYFSPAFNLLSRSLVPGVILRGLEITQDGKISLAGIAARRDDVLALVDNLKKVKEFSDVSLPASSLKEKENLNFTLSFKVDTNILKKK